MYKNVFFGNGYKPRSYPCHYLKRGARDRIKPGIRKTTENTQNSAKNRKFESQTFFNGKVSLRGHYFPCGF